MNGVLLGLIGYVALQLVIGLVVSRRIDTEDDYLVAGRAFGPWMATLSIFATWFGAESCIGAAGAVYGSGLAGATADPFGYAGCLVLMGAVFARPLWRRKLSTIADLFRQRFSPNVERLTVLMMVPTSVLWAAAQVRGFGQVVAASSNVHLELAIGAGALVAIVYTMAGGLLADAVTDMVQGTVLVLGLGVLAWFTFPNALSSQALPMAHPIGSLPSWPARLEAWSIPIIGSVWAQELGARVIACRNERVARNASLTAAALYLGVGSIPLALGLIGPSLLPGLEHHEQLLPRLAQQYLPTWGYVVFAGALISAILSTVDSALLSAASLTSHNLLVHLDPHATDRTRLWLARVGVMGFGMLAWWLALHASGVYSLVESASSFGSAGVFVAGTFGLFTRLGGPRSASAALLIGAGVWLYGAHIIEMETPYLVALLASACAYVSVAVLMERPREITETPPF